MGAADPWFSGSLSLFLYFFVYFFLYFFCLAYPLTQKKKAAEECGFQMLGLLHQQAKQQKVIIQGGKCNGDQGCGKGVS